ncbi:tRNA pseudouridine(38-40) synthase TruA [Rhodovibrionaceae bacterium A322]
MPCCAALPYRQAQSYLSPNLRPLLSDARQMTADPQKPNPAAYQAPYPLPEGTHRFRLLIEYDGGAFQGWQRQKDGPSVQQALEEAAQNLSKTPLLVQGAGRTDTGVHATGQVAHLDLDRDITAEKLQHALNFHLRPAPVSVLQVELVDADFHARFSATGRKYLYRINTRRAPLALDLGRAWAVPRDLDVDAMQAGADYLIGHHDFTSFRASHCQAKSPLKTLDVLRVSRQGDEIHIIAESRSFLHHQVRNMVGTLKIVGDGKWAPEEIKRILEAKDRRAAGPTSPPQGLYLTHVVY